MEENIGRSASDAVREIILVHELRMFAGDEEEMAKALVRKMPRLRHHLLDRERDAQDRVVRARIPQ